MTTVRAQHRLLALRCWVTVAFLGAVTAQAGAQVNILTGLAHAGGLFTEFKVGALDSPGVKFGIGYTF